MRDRPEKLHIVKRAHSEFAPNDLKAHRVQSAIMPRTCVAPIVVFLLASLAVGAAPTTQPLHVELVVPDTSVGLSNPAFTSRFAARAGSSALSAAKPTALYRRPDFETI